MKTQGFKSVLHSSAYTRKEQLVTTNGCFPTLIQSGATGTHTRLENHLYVMSPNVACTNLRVLYASFRSREGEDSSLSVSQCQLQASLVYNNQFCPVSFNGTTTTTFDPAVTILRSNPVGVYIPANTEIKVKTGAVITAGTSVAASISRSYKNVKLSSTNGLSAIFSTADVSSGTATTLGLFPLAIVGTPAKPTFSILGWGDSRTAGSGDSTANTSGGIGYFERACFNVDGNGRAIPFSNLSKSGDVATTYDVDEAFSRYATFPYAQCILLSLGTNDISSGRTFDQIKASFEEAILHANIHNLIILVGTIAPYTTSTNGWTTVANQTVVAGYADQGLRGQVNRYLWDLYTSKKVHGIVDLDSVCRDSDQIDFWKPNYTADGLHFNEACTIAIAEAFKPLLRTLSDEFNSMVS